MLNTRLSKPEWAGQEWDWAVDNGRLFRIWAPGTIKPRLFFDVLLLGQADYVACNINKEGLYSPSAPLRLFSVNGEFRMWVEGGMKGPIRGVRWEIEYSSYEDEYSKPHWKVSGDSLALLAIEKIMGELVDSKGRPIEEAVS